MNMNINKSKGIFKMMYLTTLLLATSVLFSDVDNDKYLLMLVFYQILPC